MIDALAGALLGDLVVLAQEGRCCWDESGGDAGKRGLTMRALSSLVALVSLALTVVLLPVPGGAFFAMVTFGLFLLALVHQALSGLDAWDAETTEQAVREVAEAEGAKLGQVAQPLRAALPGRGTS